MDQPRVSLQQFTTFSTNQSALVPKGSFPVKNMQSKNYPHRKTGWGWQVRDPAWVGSPSRPEGVQGEAWGRLSEREVKCLSPSRSQCQERSVRGVGTHQHPIWQTTRARPTPSSSPLLLPGKADARGSSSQLPTDTGAGDPEGSGQLTGSGASTRHKVDHSGVPLARVETQGLSWAPEP